ncbi:GTPase Era [Truepera radiovictrix]|uniref:GTPase Era n=1 Tax=Truepera radiovictrix (strain DSM 17093 / CIP 108686 / LMG 22925 / RQ-24) TaxID=649638 RepID=D7CXZ5_TRURR|nr:GTPase Era [Truepera radiovictrix]ADI13355.1 GTP-binding protein Era [Truepera radiovictrix DSM 17093]WMT58082.1 GTPase Era [Truepera radiovictrix]
MSDPSEITSPPLDAPAPQSSAEVPTYSGFVAILGKPNVGKSTLLNTFLGVKVAPITPKPQTTRRGVRGVYTDRQASEVRQLVFVDTPGFHRAKDALGEFMNREVRAAVVDVDVILWVVDLRRPPSDEDKEVARLLRGLDPSTRVYLVGNKLDAAKYPDEALELYGELVPNVSRTYRLSALEDPEAVYALRAELLGELAEGPLFFPEDIRSDQSRETWAAEIIRESAMTHLRQELPYAVAVQVLQWRDPEGDEPLYLMAELWVERANHRMIVLGKGGSMIREIGRSARKQLEVFLGHRVFLELEVVVRRAWREDPEALRELGFEG